jgi:hypothetical protein
VPSSKNGKHGIPESCAGRNERKSGRHQKKKKQETIERQIGSVVFIMEAARKTDTDEMKQEIRTGQEHIREIIETQFCSLAGKLDGWRKQMQAD